MSKEQMIAQMLEKLRKLPDTKVAEVNDFISFLYAVGEPIANQRDYTNGCYAKPYAFLEEEEDIYILQDLKVVYNAKG